MKCTCGELTTLNVVHRTDGPCYIPESQRQQEPFGYFRYDLRLDAWVISRHANAGTPFYTSPPQRKWVGIDDEEIRQTDHRMVEGAYHHSFKQGVRWAEAKLKEKNT